MSFSLDDAPPEQIARSVDQIRGLMEMLGKSLDSLCEGVSFSAPDDVVQFLAMRAGVVPIIDARLVLCGDLLRKGLRSEALGRAAEAPRLLEAAELLDLSRHKNWSTWQLGLAGQEMPEPVMPRVDLVEALKRAGNELQRLKPLLDRWRRLNLTNGSLPDKIALLRKLRKADPANDVWKESLQEHENQRLMQVERDIKQATRDRDERCLQSLVDELSAPWVEAVPNRLLAAAKAALDSFRGSRIDREIDEVGASLLAAHDARDLDAARELRRRWQPLADEKVGTDPGDARLAAAAPAVAWVDNHDRMESLLTEIPQSLDGKPPEVGFFWGGLRAWRAWVRSLERMGVELEDLAEKLPGEVDVEAVQRGLKRIGRKQAELRQHEAFRRKLMYIATGSVAVLLAAVVVIIAIKGKIDGEVAAAKAQLDKLLEDCEGGIITESPDFAEKWSPAVLDHPDVVGRLASLSGCLTTENDRRGRLAKRLTEAKAMTDAAAAKERPDPLAAWPEEFAKATRAVEEIARQSLAKSLGEQSDVERAQEAIAGLEKKWTAAADLELDGLEAAISAALDKARETVAGDMAAAEALTAQSQADIEVARSRAETLATKDAAEGYDARRVASPATVAKFGRDGKLAVKAGELQRMIGDRNSFAREVAKMPGTLGRWPEYGQLLKAVAGNYQDVPQAADFHEAAQRLPQWEAVTAWKEFVTKLPVLELCTPGQAKDVIAGFNALPQAARDLPMGRQFADEVIPAMEGFRDRNLQVLADDLQGWFAGTFQGEVPYVVTDGEEKTYYCLEPKPVVNEKFQYLTNLQHPRWVTKKSTSVAVAVKASPQATLAGKLEGQFKGAIESGLNLDDRLLAAIGLTLADPDIDPLVQLIAAFKYTLLASEYSVPVRDHQPDVMGLFQLGGGDLPGGLSVEELAMFVNPDRARDPNYITATKAARGIVGQVRVVLPQLAQAVAAERARLAAAKGDVPQLVGSIMPGAGGAAAPVWLAKKLEPGPVWWIASAKGFAEAGRVGPDGSFTPAAKPAPVGTPLWQLGPAPGQAKEAKTR